MSSVTASYPTSGAAAHDTVRNRARLQRHRHRAESRYDGDIMKTKTALLAAFTLSISTGLGTADEVGDLFKDSWKKYKSEDYGEVIGKLRDLIKLLEDKTAQRAEVVIPERVADWSGGDLKRESLVFLGGGVSVQRSYRQGAKEITVKMVKDSPLGDELMKILNNDDLIKASGKRVHTIYGEKAIVENERKLLMVVDNEIFLEITGDNDTRSADLVKFTRKLDLRSMKKMK